jgi:hypothetical protein
MDQLDEIASLNLDDLDVEELEQRLELATGDVFVTSEVNAAICIILIVNLPGSVVDQTVEFGEFG